MIYRSSGDIITVMINQDNQKEAFLYPYIAGIIDGEGTIRIGKANGKYYASISAGMTNKEIIELLSSTFGASVRIESVPNRKTIYRWGTSGNNVVPKIIKKIIPYLIAKKKQAKLILEFCEKGEKRKRVNHIRHCEDCGKYSKIQAYNLCVNCAMRHRRHNSLDKYKKRFSKTWLSIPISELQRREELYQKVKKLNVVGAPATT